MKSKLVYPYARYTSRRIYKDASDAIHRQTRILHGILQVAKKSAFGKEHNFNVIQDYQTFRQKVIPADYEALRPYIERILRGERDVLWPGRPVYFAKTSGTTSGVKYIPITSASLPNHFHTARHALFNYYIQTGKGKFLDGKMIFLSGSPEMEYRAGIPTGRLSGIVNHQVPGWLKKNQLPSYETNVIEDWEQKLERIIEETINADLRLISGIPSWVKTYYIKLLERSGKDKIKELFPNFQVFVHGGVNYAPYRKLMKDLMGEGVDTVETYPASEGFIAYQDKWPSEGLLLNVNSGIFFEFIPFSQGKPDMSGRCSLKDVTTGQDYLLLLTSNAGLYAYDIGDLVRFTTLDPYRLTVTGRSKHFLSTFGEHVIADEVERSVQKVVEKLGVNIMEFSVAPKVKGQSFHEWIIETGNLKNFPVKQVAELLDQQMQEQNIYYRDLRESKQLEKPHIRFTVPGGFDTYMEAIGKLGSQNKIPKLKNDRSLIDKMDELGLLVKKSREK